MESLFCFMDTLNSPIMLHKDKASVISFLELLDSALISARQSYAGDKLTFIPDNRMIRNGPEMRQCYNSPRPFEGFYLSNDRVTYT